MKRAIVVLAACLWTAASACAQNPEPPFECKFTLSGRSTKPKVTAPENIAKLLYVVEQLDSPIEILNVDLKAMQVQSTRGDFTWTIPRGSKVRVRNRSDQVVRRVEIFLGTLFGRWGVATPKVGREEPRELKPGQEMDIEIQSGTYRGPLPADEEVRLLLGIDWIRMKACRYRPAMILPPRFGLIEPF